MKSKIFSIVFLSILFSIAIASAVAIDGIRLIPSSYSNSVNSGTSDSFTFSINNTANEVLSNITLESSVTNLTSGSNLIDSSNIIFSLPSSIPANSSSSPISVTLNVPSNQVSGVYTGQIKIDGVYENGNTATLRNLNLNIDVINPSSPTSALTLTEVNKLTKNQNGTIRVSNTGSSTLTNIILSTTDLGIVFSPPTIPSLASGEYKLINISSTQVEDLELGDDNTAIITASSGSINNSLNIEVSAGFCKFGDIGNDLEIRDIEFTNNGIGEDDEWFLTDEIEVEVEVENNGDDDLDDIIIEWGLYDTKNNKFIIDGEEDSIDIDEDESETFTFTFNLDPDEFEEDFDENDFVFYVKAYSDDKDLGEDEECISDEVKNIKVIRDSHFVTLSNIRTDSDSTASCGAITEITATVWNIGEKDEEDVYVEIYNKDLGIDERIEIGDLDSMDSKRISFTTTIPTNLTSGKIYAIKFTVYDEDDDVFENANDDESIFNFPLKIEGTCSGSSGTISNVLINAQLDSETPDAIAGKQVIIKSSLTNVGSSTATYLVSVYGNSAWSTLGAIDPQEIILEPGQSQNINIYLNINSDVEGEQTFTVRAIQKGPNTTTEQNVSLDVKESDVANSVIAHLKENWFIYLIILINIILIIAIIIAVKRLSSPRI